MEKLRYYVVRKVTPIKNSPWKATLTQETHTAQNLNQLIMKAITPDEIKQGVKIVKILTSTDGIYYRTLKQF